MQNWQIQIKGIQKLDNEIINDFEFFTQGRGRIHPEFFQIFYKESQITGMEGVLTRLDIFSDRVLLFRSGSIRQETCFSLGEMKEFIYETPHGNILLGVRTLELEIEKDGDQVRSVKLAYEIWSQGQEKLGDHQLSLLIREAKEVE